MHFRTKSGFWKLLCSQTAVVYGSSSPRPGTERSSLLEICFPRSPGDSRKAEKSLVVDVVIVVIIIVPLHLVRIYLKLEIFRIFKPKV